MVRPGRGVSEGQRGTKDTHWWAKDTQVNELSSRALNVPLLLNPKWNRLGWVKLAACGPCPVPSSIHWQGCS